MTLCYLHIIAIHASLANRSSRRQHVLFLLSNLLLLSLLSPLMAGLGEKNESTMNIHPTSNISSARITTINNSRNNNKVGDMSNKENNPPPQAQIKSNFKHSLGSQVLARSNSLDLPGKRGGGLLTLTDCHQKDVSCGKTDSQKPNLLVNYSS